SRPSSISAHGRVTCRCSLKTRTSRPGSSPSCASGSSMPEAPDSLMRFTPGQRVLTVAAEFQRAGHWMKRGDPVEMRRCYARALDLMDRLCSLPERPHGLKEYRRWRELAAGLYLREQPSQKEHAFLEEALIQLHPDSWNALHPRAA